MEDGIIIAATASTSAWRDMRYDLDISVTAAARAAWHLSGQRIRRRASAIRIRGVAKGGHNQAVRKPRDRYQERK